MVLPDTPYTVLILLAMGTGALEEDSRSLVFQVDNPEHTLHPSQEMWQNLAPQHP